MTTVKLENIVKKIIKARSLKDLLEILKKEKTNHPYVRKPKNRKKIRHGRGWSREEFKNAGMIACHIRGLGIRYDCRRTSCHKVNVEMLKELLDLKS